MVTKAKNPAKSTTSKNTEEKTSALATQAAKAKALSLATRERKLASLLALIRRRKDRIVEDFYDIGEALRTILRDDLARARNTTFDVLVEAELGIEPSTAYKLIGVVEAFPRERAIALGQEKSYALVTYAAATAAPDTPLELVERDAKIGRKPISVVSANEIKRAATALRSRRKAPVPSDVRARAREIVSAIRALGLPRPEFEVRGRTIVIRVEV